MTPKIFATEVKKPVSRLCRLEGEKKKKEKKKKEGKEKKEKNRVCISQIPYRSAIHPPSFSLFLSSSATDLFSSSTPLRPPAFSSPSLPSFSLDCIFFHHFPGSIDIDRLRNVIVVPRRFFGRFHERRVFSKLRLHTPPPHTDRVRVTENGAVTMAFSSDWLIRYTVIRFFCRRFKILFSYSIRFHEANIERIFPPEFPEFRMKFYRGTTRHSCHWCYLVSVVSRFVLSFRLLADTWYSNSSNNYANIIRIIYKIDADINTLVGPFQRNSMN